MQHFNNEQAQVEFGTVKNVQAATQHRKGQTTMLKSTAILLLAFVALALLLTACGGSSYTPSYNSYPDNNSNTTSPTYTNGSNTTSPSYNNTPSYNNDQSVGPLPMPNGPVGPDPCSFSDGNASVEQNCRIENTDGSNPNGYGSGTDPSSSDSSSYSDSSDSSGN